jgi:hypothetical protein
VARQKSIETMFIALVGLRREMDDCDDPFSAHLIVDAHRRARSALVARGDAVLPVIVNAMERGPTIRRHEAAAVLVGLELTPRVIDALELAACRDEPVVSNPAMMRWSERPRPAAYDAVSRRIADPNSAGPGMTAAFAIDPDRARSDAPAWAASEHAEVRRALAKELVEHADESCEPALTLLVRDSDSGVRRYAFAALARVAPEAAGAVIGADSLLDAWKSAVWRYEYPPLVDIFASSSVTGADAAAAISEAFARDNIYASEAGVRLAVRRAGSGRARILAGAPHSLAERELVAALSRIGSPALEALIDAAGDAAKAGRVVQRLLSAKIVGTRARVLDAVAEPSTPGRDILLRLLPGLDAVDRLVEIAADRSDPHHAAAVFVACRAGVTSASASLESFVCGDDDKAATTALGLLLNSGAAMPGLVEELLRWARTSAYTPLLFLVVRALRELDDPRAVAALEALGSSRLPNVQNAARRALGELGHA